MTTAIHILLDSNRGIYIPRDFEAGILWRDFDNVPNDIEVLKNPDHENYWDVWADVIDNATWTDKDGNTFILYQDGDVFLMCPELMTEEEKRNFDLID